MALSTRLSCYGVSSMGRIVACAILVISLVFDMPTSSRAAGNSANQAGVYVDWGSPWGRESNVQAFEGWLGRKGLLALDYMPGDSWSNMAATAKWLPGYWWQGNPHRNVVWSIALAVSGTSLAQVASGAADETFQTVAGLIARGQPKAIIRIGWEANGDWFAWSAANGQQANYISAFRHVVDIFRKASPDFLIDWCVNIGAVNVPADQIYPGDQYVDIVGMDIYDKDALSQINPKAAWQKYLTGSYGLTWHREFAAKHHKPMSYPEWGMGDRGDNPYFVTSMADWMANNNVVYNIYWNTNASYPGMISTGQYPQAAKEFRRLKP
jgi:hypothetical protein